MISDLFMPSFSFSVFCSYSVLIFPQPLFIVFSFPTPSQLKESFTFSIIVATFETCYQSQSYVATEKLSIIWLLGSGGECGAQTKHVVNVVFNG